MGTWNPGPGPTEGNDHYQGDGLADEVNGLGGDDVLIGGGGPDRLNGGLGNDTISGGEETDVLTSGGGGDIIDGGAGMDTAFLDYSAEVEAITLLLDDADELTPVLRGGLSYGSITGVETIRFIGGAGNDHVTSIVGNLGNYNRLEGRGGNDVLIGSSAVDYLDGGEGDDILDGGAGEGDTAIYTEATAGVVVDFEILTPQDTVGAGIDTILNIEGFEGSSHGDTFLGNDLYNLVYAGAGDDVVYGRGGHDDIRGQDGDDYIDGGLGNDSLDGGVGDDVIYGGEGDDGIFGGFGRDELHGGDGNDNIGLGDLTNEIVRHEMLGDLAYGGEGNDRINGSLHGDMLYGDGGDDQITDWFGADTIYGGDGNDFIKLVEWTSPAYPWPEWIVDYAEGGDGDDYFEGGYGDHIIGGAHGPLGDGVTLILENPFNILEQYNIDFRTFDPNVPFALPGGGYLLGVEHVWEVFLNWASDTLYHTDDGGWLDGGGGDDAIYGRGGDDYINGNGNNDYLDGGNGNDILFGSAGNDHLIGGAGDDDLEGWEGNDIVEAGEGDDLVRYNRLGDMGHDPAQIDVFDGGDGNDTMSFRGLHNGNSSDEGVTFSLSITGPQSITMGALRNFGFLTATGFENLMGTQKDDTLTGTDEANYIHAGNGNDFIYGLGGDDILDGGQGGDRVDHIDGGDGYDTVAYELEYYDEWLTVSLFNPSANTGAARGDTFVSIEAVSGSRQADTLIGDNNDNRLTGGGDNDVLDGMGGVDAAIYRVASTGATWTRSVSGAWSVNAGADGVDTLTGIEALHFTDRTVALDNAQQTFFGDGASDLLWRNANHGTVVIWDMAGATQESATIAGGAPSDWAIVGAADLNGDGKDDMIWRNADHGGVAGWLMNGAAPTTTAMVGGAPLNWEIAGLGDFNFDGRADFLWRNSSDGGIAVWLQGETGLSSQSQVMIGGAPLSWNVAAVADFDGDGRDDILLRHDDGTLARWTTDGLTQTSAAIVGGAPAEWSIAGTGDFDGDGRADIVLHNQSSGDIALWRMNGDTQAGVGIIGAAPLEWSIAQVGDFSADGCDDLLLRHDDGTIALWTMNGCTVTNQSIIGFVPTEWDIV